MEDIRTMAVITASNRKSFFVPCPCSALENGHTTQELPIFLEECKLFEGRDTVAFLSLEPSTMLGIDTQQFLLNKGLTQ